MHIRKCIECDKTINARGNQKFCSDDCRYLNWARTNRPSKAAPRPCWYCGLPSNSIDHVPPKSARAKIAESEDLKWIRFVTVDACMECNMLLGARPLWTTWERKKFIKKALRRKYVKYLRMPDWMPQEAEELGYRMSQYLQRSIIIRDVTIERLGW